MKINRVGKYPRPLGLQRSSVASIRKDIPTADSQEDETIQVIESAGWETLADGSQQLRIHCASELDYATLPRNLKFGRIHVVKSGWDWDKKLAYYRDIGKPSESQSSVGGDDGVPERSTEKSIRQVDLCKKTNPGGVE